MSTPQELRAIKSFLWTVEDGLNRASRDHRMAMAYGKPRSMPEETYRAQMDQESERLISEWDMLRKLKKEHGIK